MLVFLRTDDTQSTACICRQRTIPPHSRRLPDILDALKTARLRWFHRSLSPSGMIHFLLQVLRDSSTKMGKISKRPASISKLSMILERLLKWA